MSLTMPDWFKAATMEISLDRATVTHTSQTTKMTQMVDLYSWQWRFSVQFPPCGIADSGAREALVNRLAGGAETISLYHRYRPLPIGTMRGTPTLNANAAQFANQIQIAGAWDTSRQNLLARSNYFSDAAWAKGETVLSSNTDGPDGGVSSGFVLREAATTAQHFMHATPTITAGQTYTGTFYLRAGTDEVAQLYFGGGGMGAQAFATVNLTTGSIGTKGTDCAVSVSPPGVGGWRRVSLTATAIASLSNSFGVALVNNSMAAVRVPTYAGDLGANIHIAWAQLEVGSVATEYIPTTTAARFANGTLNAGDMIGLSGQLLQVADDAVSNDSGVMTVNLVNRLRTSATSGASIVWDKPTAEFYLADGKARSVYSPNMGGGQALEFVERVS